MARDDSPSGLRQVPILAALPASLLDELAALGGERSLGKGELIFGEGDEAAFLPILLAGKVKLSRLGVDGREQVLHIVRAPASFAEAAVFGPGIFPANAQAVTNGRLLTVPRPALLHMLRTRPEVALALLASMSMWLRRLVDLVEGLSLHSVEERVCAYLGTAFARAGQALVPGAQLRLDDPKFLIAALCGTAPEVLSRTFRKLENDGVVRVSGSLVTLLDPVRLASCSGLAAE